MSNSNSNEMKLEEQIVQQLKDQTIFSLLGDEDKLTALVKDYLNKFLFHTRYKNDPNDRSFAPKQIAVLSPVDEVALEVTKEHLHKIVDSLINDELVRKCVQEYIVAAVPGILTSILTQNFASSMEANLNNYAFNSMAALQVALGDRFQIMSEVRSASITPGVKPYVSSLEEATKESTHKDHSALGITSKQDTMLWNQMPHKIKMQWQEEMNKKKKELSAFKEGDETSVDGEVRFQQYCNQVSFAKWLEEKFNSEE